MVTFVSLFLWLVTGVQTVEVAVGPEVARVEIVLDGKQVGEMEGDPWLTRCNFGNLLEPHELVAIAYSADDVELGRATQIVNLPRPEAEAKIVMESSPEGKPAAFRVITESSDRKKPLGTVAVFDGRVLSPESEDRYLVPDHDPDGFHLISVEVSYPNGTTARADVGFGGAYGRNIATELTAVPIRVGTDPPKPADLEGRITVRGRPLQVATVEQSGAAIYVVRDADVFPTFRAAGRYIARRFEAIRNYQDPIFEFDLDPEVGRVRLVGTNPDRERDLWLFPVSSPVSLKRWSLPWAATTLVEEEATSVNQRIADAMAVAGVRAAGRGSPRAVVLALSADPKDDSRYSPRSVRHYLGQLGVPIYVWVTPDVTSEGADEVANTDWGPAVPTATARSMTRASKRLLRDLDQQWVIWVEGLHLINHIELDGSDLGIELVGRVPHPPGE
jgi:hypothetical protein